MKLNMKAFLFMNIALVVVKPCNSATISDKRRRLRPRHLNKNKNKDQSARNKLSDQRNLSYFSSLFQWSNSNAEKGQKSDYPTTDSALDNDVHSISSHNKDTTDQSIGGPHDGPEVGEQPTWNSYSDLFQWSDSAIGKSEALRINVDLLPVDPQQSKEETNYYYYENSSNVQEAFYP